MQDSLQSLLGSWVLLFSEDPSLRVFQGALLLAGVFVVFLIFFTTRDIILRTRSFWYQLFCIVLVTFLPVVGFFLYLLIRPPTTLVEQEMQETLEALLELEKKKRK